MNHKTSQRSELRNRQHPAAAPAAIARAVGSKDHRGWRLDGGSGLRRFHDPEPRLPVRVESSLLAPRNREIRLRGREYQVTIAARRKQAPSLRLRSVWEHQDRVSVRELQPHVAAFGLLGGYDDQSIALVHPA